MFNWICQLSKPRESLVKIEQDGSFFLTFNYTHTLEDLYHIPSKQVLHIHGNFYEEESIVYGHGTDIDNLHNRVKKSLPKAPTAESLSDDEYYDVISDFEIEHSTQLAIDATLSGVLSLKKDVEKIIKRNDSFFQSLLGIGTVYVLGFSFSHIDMPYLENIIKRTSPETRWIISWYSPEDLKRIKQFVAKYEIQNITTINEINHID